MGHLLNQFLPVVIEVPCKQWENEEAAQLFLRMCRLKMRGYGARYANGVLPVDTTDLIGTHLLVCIPSDEGLQPVMGVKSVEFQQCRDYQVEFPGLSLVKRAGSPRHIAAVEKIIQDCSDKNEKLAYLGSWTVDPTYSWDGPTRHLLKELYSVLYALYYMEKDIRHSILGGTLRFKTEQVFFELGYRPLEENGRQLPNIQVSHLRGEPVMVMHVDGLNLRALRLAKEYAEWWKSRRVFSENEVALSRAA